MRFGGNRPAPKRAGDLLTRLAKDVTTDSCPFCARPLCRPPDRVRQSVFPYRARAFVADRLFTSDRQSIKVFAVAADKNPDIRVIENASDPRHGDPPLVDKTIRVINTHTHTPSSAVRVVIGLPTLHDEVTKSLYAPTCVRALDRPDRPRFRVTSRKRLFSYGRTCIRTPRVNPYAPARPMMVSRIIRLRNYSTARPAANRRRARRRSSHEPQTNVVNRRFRPETSPIDAGR